MVKPNVSPLTPVPGLIPFIYSHNSTVQLLRPINNNDFFYKVFVLNIEMDTEAIRYRQKACYGVTKMADDETEVAFRRL